MARKKKIIVGKLKIIKGKTREFMGGKKLDFENQHGMSWSLRDLDRKVDLGIKKSTFVIVFAV